MHFYDRVNVNIEITQACKSSKLEANIFSYVLLLKTRWNDRASTINTLCAKFSAILEKVSPQIGSIPPEFHRRFIHRILLLLSPTFPAPDSFPDSFLSRSNAACHISPLLGRDDVRSVKRVLYDWYYQRDTDFTTGRYDPVFHRIVRYMVAMSCMREKCRGQAKYVRTRHRFDLRPRAISRVTEIFYMQRCAIFQNATISWISGATLVIQV